MQNQENLDTIKCVVIDDEKHCLELMKILLHRLPYPVEIVKLCQSPTEGLKALKEHKIDLLFLDVKMPEMSGFDLLERLGNWDFGIVFTTAHFDYVIQALRISAIDYLLKPIQQKELDAAVSSFIHRGRAYNHNSHSFMFEQIKAIQNGVLERVALPSLDGITFLEITSIIAAISDGNLSKIYLTNGDEVYINQSLKYIEARLESFGFMRVHKCYLINLNRIKKYSKKEGGYIEMENQMLIHLSRHKKQIFLMTLERMGGGLP